MAISLIPDGLDVIQLDEAKKISMIEIKGIDLDYRTDKWQ